MHTIDIELVLHAKPKECKLRGTTTLGYSRKELALSLCYICVILKQGAQLSNIDIEGFNLLIYYILGYLELFFFLCLTPPCLQNKPF
jgi:hypothetical protein